MKNFNLRSFLTENKLTQYSKQVQEAAKPGMKVSELKALVKELLDETSLNEALNKPLQDFGPDLQKRLQTVGFNTKLSSEAPSDEIQGKLRENPKLAYIHFYRSGNNEEIVIYAGGKAQQKIQKVVDYFNLDSSQYGPDKDAGWVIKNAINKNPGDIMVSNVELINQLTNVRFYRFDKGAYKNVKTTDKATGQADYLQAAE